MYSCQTRPSILWQCMAEESKLMKILPILCTQTIIKSGCFQSNLLSCRACCCHASPAAAFFRWCGMAAASSLLESHVSHPHPGACFLPACRLTQTHLVVLCKAHHLEIWPWWQYGASLGQREDCLWCVIWEVNYRRGGAGAGGACWRGAA